MGVHAYQNCDGGAQRSDLRQREIDKDDAALHHVHTQVSMDAGQNQTGHKWPDQKRKNLHRSPRGLLRCLESFGQQTNIVIKELEVVRYFLFPANRGQVLDDLSAGFASDRLRRF